MDPSRDTEVTEAGTQTGKNGNARPSPASTTTLDARFDDEKGLAIHQKLSRRICMVRPLGFQTGFPRIPITRI